MKLALISSPVEYRSQEQSRLGYHLVLAQEFLTDKAYQAIYMEKRRQGHYIIMDNGAAEFGRSIRFSDVLEAANAVGADEVCLPDVLGDREATLELHYKYYEKVPSPNRMVIPQGKDGYSWMGCLDDMLEVFDFFAVGIPKHLDGAQKDRLWVLDSLQKRGYHTMFHVHLLGCHAAPLKEIRDVMKKYPWVRGIDTAAPFGYAQFNQSVAYSRHLSYDWHKTVENIALANQNILDLVEACNGSH